MAVSDEQWLALGLPTPPNHVEKAQDPVVVRHMAWMSEVVFLMFVRLQDVESSARKQLSWWQQARGAVALVVAGIGIAGTIFGLMA